MFLSKTGDGTQQRRDYGRKERGKRWVLRHERKQFWDRDKCLKVCEADEWVIFVIFLMGSLLTSA